MMDEDEEQPELPEGKVSEPAVSQGPIFGSFAASLWIPDPTERRGWRDVWIQRKGPEPKSIGFRPGGKGV